MDKRPSADTGHLSSHLQWSIEEWDSWDTERKDEESDVDPELVRELIRVAASSVEGFAESTAKKLLQTWEGHEVNWRYIADDFYSRETVANIPGMVKRFL